MEERDTRKRTEMLALLVIMGGAIVVLSFLYMVRPNFKAIEKFKKELSETEKEMAKGKKEMDELTATIEHGEKAVLSGLGAGPPLTKICAQAARALNPKPAYGDQTNKELLVFTERGADGKPVTRHYDEVSRTLDISAVDFFDLCQFLSAIESTNEGLRVAHFEIDTASLEAGLQGKGKVNAKFELSMVGLREGEQPEEIQVSAPEGFAQGDARNPFGLAGIATEPTVDPLVRVQEKLRRLRIKGIWGDWLLVESPERARTGEEVTRSVRMNKGEPMIIAGNEVKYLGREGEAFVFEATKYAARFVLETDFRGEVKRIVKKEEAK